MGSGGRRWVIEGECLKESEGFSNRCVGCIVLVLHSG